MSNYKSIIISGEIYSDIDTEEFAMLLSEKGIYLSLGDSSQYQNNTYVRIKEGITNFTLEKYKEEYTVMGYSSSCEQMYKAAVKVSNILTMLNIRHAFEIYGDSDKLEKLELLFYLHHDCPQSDFA